MHSLVSRRPHPTTARHRQPDTWPQVTIMPWCIATLQVAYTRHQCLRWPNGYAPFHPPNLYLPYRYLQRVSSRPPGLPCCLSLRLLQRVSSRPAGTTPRRINSQKIYPTGLFSKIFYPTGLFLNLFLRATRSSPRHIPVLFQPWPMPSRLWQSPTPAPPHPHTPRPAISTPGLSLSDTIFPCRTFRPLLVYPLQRVPWGLLSCLRRCQPYLPVYHPQRTPTPSSRVPPLRSPPLLP